MSHSHNHHHHHHGHAHHDHHGSNLALAFWLNTAFAVIELIGGLLTNSVAILSDAVHDLGDSLALGSAWLFEKHSKKRRDEKYTYGYKRFSLVGALINAVVLLVGSIFILHEAIGRFFDPVQPDVDGMIYLAVLGVVVNGFAILRLRKGTSISEHVISLHFVEDVVGWIAVLIGSVVMKFTDAPFLDPALSVLISIYIIVNVFRHLKVTFRIILQGVPDSVSEQQVVNAINNFPEVESTHDVHLWTLDGNYNILTTHIVLHEPLDLVQTEQLKSRIKGQLRTEGVHHATIEFEVKGLTCENTMDEREL